MKRGRVIAAGFHHRAGLPHAEVEALRRAGEAARGATLYVTLEPCNHTGRTPPCCEAILRAGIRRVVAGAIDPNPVTRGRGVAWLRRAGLEVITGVLAEDSRALNRPFWKAMTRRLPWTIAKIGQSLDGKIATRTGASRWITAPEARRLAHAWRGRVDAVVVGITTVLRDDARLTARGIAHRPGFPVRVIMDSRLRIPLSARCLVTHAARTIIATTVPATHPKTQALRKRGVEVISFRSQRGRVPLARLFHELVARQMHSVLIEGGGEILAAALRERLVDRVMFFIAPRLIGGRTAPGSVGGVGIQRLAQAVRLTEVVWHRVGPDLCIEANVAYPRR